MAMGKVLTCLAWVLMVSACFAQDFDSDGPCGYNTSTFELDLSSVSGSLGSILVTVTSPSTHVDYDPTTRVSANLPPLVFFFNGFKMKAKYYAGFAQRLASWGYFVVQYDTLPWWRVVPDKVELQVLPFLLEWMKTQLWAVDLGKIAVAGHSRGAKLAALHFIGQSNLSPMAAYLVDPVDCNKFGARDEQTPCALELLEGKNRPLAMTGASIRGECNPLGSGFHAFFNVSGHGSWAFELSNCGHMKFIQASPVVQKVLDALCGGGSVKREEARRLTLAPLLAWLELNVKQKQVPEFLQWAQQQVADGSFTFQKQPGQIMGQIPAAWLF